MFVFVTPNSIVSNWIYFESGFAYSKGIEVIPVGIGIDIALLKAPLSLLQGFNISSSDGMNNFVSVINKKFDYRFEEKFTDVDYSGINILQNKGSISIDFRNIFSSINSELLSEYEDGQGGKIICNIEDFFEKMIGYLDCNGIKYSQTDSKSSKIILVYGIKIIYTIGKKQDDSGSVKQKGLDKIDFIISPYNFEKSFSLFVKLIQLLLEEKWIYLNFKLNSGYKYLTGEEHLAAIFSMYPEEYGFSEKNAGYFKYRDSSIEFSILSFVKFIGHLESYDLMRLAFWPDKVSSSDVGMLLCSLQDMGVIMQL